MTKRTIQHVLCLTLVAFCAQLAMPPAISADSKAERKKKALQEKLRKLQEKKLQLQKRSQQSTTVDRSRERLPQVIQRYEKLLAGCEGKKSDRCSDIMFTLAKLYYDADADNYIKRREEYERKMDAWERNPVGPEPVNPVPDYTRSLDMYRRLVREYPDFERYDECQYQIGNILLLAGEIDKSEEAFKDLLENNPTSVRASAAHFRLGDFAYMKGHVSRALKHFDAVKREEVNIEVWEMSHYRRAELYYNRAEFDKAVELFFEYVEKCDAGEYVKREFRDEALEFMAISFSDMPGGATTAMKFFDRHGHKPYEDYVIYTIGKKNREHGQFDDAIVALRAALENYPFYKDAPIAQHMLVECLVVKKKHEKANEEREKLVDNYWKGSEWYQKNTSERAIIDQAKEYVKRALSNVCIYYHAEAQRKKDRAAYQKALDRYLEFFEKFPDDKWKTYEFKYNCAEVYNDLGEYDKAVDFYWYVAMEDLDKYPEYTIDVDSLLYDDPKEYEKARQKAQKGGAMAISQEDAGYNAIVALDKARKKKIAEGGLEEQQTYELPETRGMLNKIVAYRKRFPTSPATAELIYLAGNLHYLARAYDRAIDEFKAIVDNHPQTKIAPKAFRMLAKSYSSAGQHEKAVSKYKELLTRTDPKTEEYQEVVDLAAAAIYSKADKMREAGNYLGAADVFKDVFNQFPKSKVAAPAWFEAGVCYEEADSPQLAAATFEGLPTKFAQSDLREKAFLRAAENYKKIEKWEMAANVYAKAAATITKADFAIPSLSSAAETYQKVNNYDKAGQMFELVFQRYADDSRTPQALYNGGLILEKGKLYERAIKSYRILAEKYPRSEYAEEASYSIGHCYKEMGRQEEAAEAFEEFAKKFENKAKQVEALIAAGDAYYKLKKYKDGENNYLSAATLYDKFKKKVEFNIASVAKAAFRLGRIYHKEYDAIKLTGRRERDVRKALKEKTRALEKVLKQYALAIETGVQDWVLRATYEIGESFVSMADAERNQKLFGSKDQRIASKINIILKLEKYYIKAQEKYYWNIQKAHDDNIEDAYVDSSISAFMEMGYRIGRLFEEVGEILASAPAPSGLSKEELQAYKEILEEKKLEAMDKALPKYEEAVKAAQDLGIARSQWLDSCKARIRVINPTSQWLTVDITPWTPGQSRTADAGGQQAGGEEGAGNDGGAGAGNDQALQGQEVDSGEQEQEEKNEAEGRKKRKKRGKR